MKLEYDQEEQRFRDEVRTFLADKLPADIRATGYHSLFGHLPKEHYVRWTRILNERGWAAPGWPEEYGGTGWSAVQRHIFNEESALAGAPQAIPFGVSMVGPVIIQYGTDAQKERFLPRIRNLDDFWCQGYSEPGSGSDLASLTTRAERDGEQYVVNGQKIWTTLAHWADWIFCLVRTGGGTRKQEGISFLLIDMSSPGVEVRPIITIDGRHELNEVFFEDVRVPVENRVGEEGKGWSVAKFLLGHERTGTAGVGQRKSQLAWLKMLMDGHDEHAPVPQDALLRTRVAEQEIELMALEVTNLRALAAVQGGSAAGAMPSMLKIRGTEIQQRLGQLAMEAAGPGAAPRPQEVESAAIGNPSPHYFLERASSIYGGSNEIQRNIITKAMLGL